MTTPDQPIAAQPYVKVFTQRCDLEIRAFITIFHRWVKEQRTADLLIDVHDYSHVHEGPGVILVAHEAHLGMDRRGGRLGLVYRARRTPATPVGEGLAAAARAAIAACTLLEADAAGALTFNTEELLVGFEDRLHAPNDEATFAAFQAPLAAFATQLFGEEARVERTGEDRDVFGARLTGPRRPLQDLAAALSPG